MKHLKGKNTTFHEKMIKSDHDFLSQEKLETLENIYKLKEKPVLKQNMSLFAVTSHEGGRVTSKLKRGVNLERESSTETSLRMRRLTYTLCRKFTDSGRLQTITVLIFSIMFNFVRFFEHR